MPISFFVYLLGTFGCMVSMITANHTLDPFDFLYSDWVDQLLMTYFAMTFVFVCWWGVMRRLEVTVTCIILQPFTGLAIGAMTAVPDLYPAEVSMNTSSSDTFVILFLMAVIFMLVHGLGNMIRLIAQFIVAMGQRYLNT
jgi:succinate dehydrogenase hydrophobic anchor subunit